ncbi:translation initiation factor IF-2-like isoform X2 [Ctenopharyngodon idella]|uniref:translation initiation factor IF-2-like isoform X2 n=1 Tax=Ctenopharyngodon idella TaxID=7959 RepID=UPI00222E2FB2|nr:translation initiation factor IF-2-like isoform X2 [Ctenopharyngodon idella]
MFLPLPLSTCINTVLNKSLQMDPRSADPSLQKTSPSNDPAASTSASSLSMDPAIRLVRLRQGNCTLEDHIQKFLDIAYFSDLPDCALIDFFGYGLNEPLKDYLLINGPRGSFVEFLDFALLTVGSLFTVGVAEERDTSSPHVMAASKESLHKMAATTSSHHVSADLPEPSQVSVDPLELHHVSGSVWERSGLRSSVADPALTSVRAAGIPKPPPAASHSSSPVATHSSSPVATHSSSPVATHSSSPVATHSSSPVATHSSSPVATHSNSLDAMDKMAALPVPTGKMAAPPVSGNIGVVPASESTPEPAPVRESAPTREPAAAPSEEVGIEPPPQPCKRRRRRRKKACLPAPPELLALPAPPELLALPAPPELLTHETATASVEFPKNFFWGGAIYLRVGSLWVGTLHGRDHQRPPNCLSLRVGTLHAHGCPSHLTCRGCPSHLTRRGCPWNLTHHGYPWHLTRRGCPWHLTRRGCPWHLTRRGCPWHLTPRGCPSSWTCIGDPVPVCQQVSNVPTPPPYLCHLRREDAPSGRGALCHDHCLFLSVPGLHFP